MLSVAATLAYRQLTHRGSKLTGALLGVCVAILQMFTQMGFQNALNDSVVAIPRALDADLLIAAPSFHSWGDSPPWMARGLLYEAEGVEGVRSVLPFYSNSIQISSPVDGHSMSSYLLAFQPRHPIFRRDDINAAVDRIAMADSVIMDAKSRDDFDLLRDAARRDGAAAATVLGVTESLQKTIQVTGEFGIGPSFTIDGTMITSDVNYYRITGIPLDRVALGVVRIEDDASAETVRDALSARLGPRARVFTLQGFVENEIAYYSGETPVGYIFRMGLVVGIAVGLVFISQALHGIVQDNMREYATLRAIGYPQNFFILLIGTIAASLSMMAFIPSALLSWGLYHLIAQATLLPLHMKPGDMAQIFLIVLAMALVASFFAIRKLKTADPVDLFA